jgi:thioredoxin-related protein
MIRFENETQFIFFNFSSKTNFPITKNCFCKECIYYCKEIILENEIQNSIKNDFNNYLLNYTSSNSSNTNRAPTSNLNNLTNQQSSVRVIPINKFATKSNSDEQINQQQIRNYENQIN